MFDKAAFLASLKHEGKILKHLAAQLKPEQLDWRPTPGQRSTIELLRYLTIGAQAATGFALTGNWDGWDALEAKAQTVDQTGFAKAIDRQVAAIVKALAPISDATLKRRQVTTFAGQKLSLGAGLVEMVLKQLTAYRMQLFLYAKQSGLSHLGTSDVWAGKAAKAKAG